MMRLLNVWLFLSLMIIPPCVISCSENDDSVEEFPDWENQNVQYFDEIYQKAVDNVEGNWKVIKNYTYDDTIAVPNYGYIAVEVLQEGTGSGCPMFSDSVLVNYSGHLLPSTSYPEGYVFDGNYQGDYNPLTAIPAQFYVGDLVDGFSTALQYMHIGDVWRVYVPYQLGYGKAGYGSIPGYSTLIFDIALIAYFRANASVTPWHSKRTGEWITQ